MNLPEAETEGNQKIDEHVFRQKVQTGSNRFENGGLAVHHIMLFNDLLFASS